MSKRWNKLKYHKQLLVIKLSLCITTCSSISEYSESVVTSKLQANFLNKGGKFLKKLWCCVKEGGGGGKEGERGREDYNKIVSGVSRLDVPGADLRWYEVV